MVLTFLSIRLPCFTSVFGLLIVHNTVHHYIKRLLCDDVEKLRSTPLAPEINCLFSSIKVRCFSKTADINHTTHDINLWYN